MTIENPYAAPVAKVGDSASDVPNEILKRPFALFFCLLWRTAVSFIFFSLALSIPFRFLSVLGVEFPSPETFFEPTMFIILKPTLFYAASALTLLFIVFVLRINPVKLIAGSRLNLPPSVWRRYVVALSALLFFLSAANLAVAMSASLDVWVSYKLTGFPLLLIGIFGASAWAAKGQSLGR
jgi:intracellular septation protein A